VLQKGVFGWGLTMCGTFVGMQVFRQPDQLLHIILTDVPIWLAAGIFFGVSTWYAMEWQYKRYLRKLELQNEKIAP
jgi:hypothetical protein